MTRIKNKSNKKHKEILKNNEGFKLSNSKNFKEANQENIKSLHYAFINRKKKKNDFRKLWTKRISNTIKSISFNKLTNKLKLEKIIINRKILSKIIKEDPKGLKIIVLKTKLP